MTTPTHEGITEAGREAYLRELFTKALEGDGDSGVQLGKIASGRRDLPLARELFIKLEGKPQEVKNG